MGLDASQADPPRHWLKDKNRTCRDVCTLLSLPSSSLFAELDQRQ